MNSELPDCAKSCDTITETAKEDPNCTCRVKKDGKNNDKKVYVWTFWQEGGTIGKPKTFAWWYDTTEAAEPGSTLYSNCAHTKNCRMSWAQWLHVEEVKSELILDQVQFTYRAGECTLALRPGFKYAWERNWQIRLNAKSSSEILRCFCFLKVAMEVGYETVEINGKKISLSDDELENFCNSNAVKKDADPYLEIYWVFERKTGPRRLDTVNAPVDVVDEGPIGVAEFFEASFFMLVLLLALRLLGRAYVYPLFLRNQ